MAIGIKREALVPGLTFSGLLLLIVAAVRLDLYPPSKWLWWINLTIGGHVDRPVAVRSGRAGLRIRCRAGRMRRR